MTPKKCSIFFGQQSDSSFQPLTETRFHVPSAVVPAMYKRRRPVMGAACNRCCKESQVIDAGSSFILTLVIENQYYSIVCHRKPWKFLLYFIRQCVFSALVRNSLKKSHLHGECTIFLACICTQSKFRLYRVSIFKVLP